ncbi:hypothetical protein OGAPHI_003654 [Ogataea philodendri]|uniref:Ubiquitin-like protease family profile domain-containing protein n=1 Tax=Ogataea philodendri TaxID=1378263 RepID=A0A9P8P5M0_9ASCO|nr:uncharacterized protein OGAPHI_003654 [Ogataea philodendri]KAH3665470.1 hypothetical protein OGAPHI_003654 [Ogataea philodendri]
MSDLNNINLKTRGQRSASDDKNFFASSRDFSLFSRLPSSAPSFTYNNLPSFRNVSSLYDNRQPSTNSNVGNVPFVPREAMLNDNFKPSSRGSSGISKLGTKTVDPQKLTLTTKAAPATPEADFLDFLKCLLLILYQLGKKAALWAVFLLTLVGNQVIKLVERIPEPETAVVDGISSTPIKREIDGITGFLNKMVPNSLSTPLGHVVSEEEKPVKSSSSKISQLASKLNESAVNKKDYGTFFYKPTTARPDLDIEAMFLKSNLSKSADKENYKSVDSSQELQNKASQITSSLRTMFPLAKSVKDNRSTSRFQNLEWLKKDNVDYVENLESSDLFKEYQKIMQERTKMQELIKLTKSRDSTKVRPLSSDQLAVVEKFWRNPDPRKLVSSAFNIDIYTRDLKTLADRKWLNDNVIDFYMSLICERAKNDPSLPQIHIFSTHFYTNLSTKGYSSVKRWTKRAKVDVTKLDYIFVPINLNQSHWALGVINNKEKAFQYYDSLYGNGEDVIYNLEQYMVNETKKLYGDSMNGIDYSQYDSFESMKTPKQENGFDCGVFVCTFVDYLSRERPLMFSQSDMKSLRRRMAYELCIKKLIDH